MQLLASIRNIAISNPADRQEKLHIQPTVLTKIKTYLKSEEMSEKSEIKINDLKQNILGNSSTIWMLMSPSKIVFYLR